MVGTIFCHCHDEAEVYGSDPVPCPLCGRGASEESSPDAGTSGPRDSNEALRHALFDGSGAGEEAAVHW